MISEEENFRPYFVKDYSYDYGNDNNKLLCGGPRNGDKWLVRHKETCSRLRLPELPTEIWVEIMWKLPIKLLHVCKCVSKTWHSYVSQILTSQKGVHLPPCGILFDIMLPPSDVNKREFYLGFLSLAGDNKLRKWSVGSQSESATITLCECDHQNAHKAKVSGDHGSGLLLGNLTLEFSSMMAVKSKTIEYDFWSMHRGLILGVLDLHTYLVYNPATKENFTLFRPASQASLNRGSMLVAIINLSDCPLSAECNFRVVRFVRAISKTKTKGMLFVEVYSSNKREWCVSRFHLKNEVIKERWNLISGVFVNNTLFFLTNKRHAVGAKFDSDGQVSSVYSLRLPQRITRGYCESTLDGSQGCLYLSYHKFPNLWIWKHTGNSTHADAWIPQLVFKNSGISLCQPVIENFLRQSVADHSVTYPMIIHPQAPVVFMFVNQSIFAIHLFNDTVEKIVEMTEREVPMAGFAFMYTPCFASFKCLKPANQDHCK